MTQLKKTSTLIFIIILIPLICFSQSNSKEVAQLVMQEQFERAVVVKKGYESADDEHEVEKYSVLAEFGLEAPRAFRMRANVMAEELNLKENTPWELSNGLLNKFWLSKFNGKNYIIMLYCDGEPESTELISGVTVMQVKDYYYEKAMTASTLE